MKTTYQVIRDTESGEYEDYSHDRHVIFEAKTEAIAKLIARKECEKDHKGYDYDDITPIEEVKIGNDYGFGFGDGDKLTIDYLVHRADVYETEQEYLHDLSMREKAEREHNLAMDAWLDFENYTNLRTFPCGWIEYAIEEINDHITVNFWDERKPNGTLYQCQYDNGKLCAVRKWDRRLSNGNADPDSCTIYMM